MRKEDIVKELKCLLADVKGAGIHIDLLHRDSYKLGYLQAGIEGIIAKIELS